MPKKKDMDEYERRFYKEHMKGIRDALKRGDEQEAQRLANKLMSFFNVK